MIKKTESEKWESIFGRISTIDDVSIFPLSWAENLILEHLGCAICAEKHLSELKICKLAASDNFTLKVQWQYAEANKRDIDIHTEIVRISHNRHNTTQQRQRRH